MAQSYNGFLYSAEKYGTSVAVSPVASVSGFNVNLYNAEAYNGDLFPAVGPPAFYRYNDFLYNFRHYNGLTVATALVLTETLALLPNLQKADSMTIEDDGIVFLIGKGPLETLRLHDWLRLERKPPVFPWTSGPIPS